MLEKLDYGVDVGLGGCSQVLGDFEAEWRGSSISAMMLGRYEEKGA